MSQQPLRSRVFAGVAALSGVGAALAVNGAGFVSLSDPPSSVEGARSRIDPNKALKRPSFELLGATHDPYSHLVRLAGFYPPPARGLEGDIALSLSLSGVWIGLPGGADGTTGAERRPETIPLGDGLDGRFVNLTFDVDAQYDAPRWGN